MSTICRTLRYIGLIAFASILLLSVGYSPHKHQPSFTIAIGGLVWWAGKRILAFSNHDARSARKAVFGLLVIGGAVRFLWAIFIPTLPVSDFEYYHTVAIKLSQGAICLSKNIGYPFLLSLGYRLYPDPMAGKLINASASTLSLILLYLIGSKLARPAIGMISLFLFAILPSEVNMVSVLGTEVVTTSIILLVTLCLLYGLNVDLEPKHLIAICCAGLFYGLGLIIRSSILFYFPGVVLFLFLAPTLKPDQKLKLVAVLLLGMLTALCMVVVGYSLSQGKFSIAPLRTQDSFPLLSGTNIRSSGEWN